MALPLQMVQVRCLVTVRVYFLSYSPMRRDGPERKLQGRISSTKSGASDDRLYSCQYRVMETPVQQVRHV